MSESRKKKSLCPVSGKCGGCDYIDKSYEEQLADKQTRMDKLFGGMIKPEMIVSMENPYNYRNKIIRTFHHVYGKDIISGIYEEGTHRVVKVDGCLIEDKSAQSIIDDVTKLLVSFKIKAYNEDTGYGLMRHMIIRTGKNTGEIMVVLVTSNPVFPSKNNFAKALVKLHPEITTIVQNINDKKTTMVIGQRNQTMYGKGYIEDVLCGKRFRISPQSFYQVNPVQTEKLYNKAIEYANLKGDETVIDAYCGIGTIGIVAADHAKEVIGVELNKEAVRDAITNSKINNVKNITFYNNDAGVFMTGMAQNPGSSKVDVVFMDPPRSGSSEEFIAALHRLMPDRIVYISCGPDTLARDLKLITKGGKYKVSKLCPVDLFPLTNHVECVCLLSRK